MGKYAAKGTGLADSATRKTIYTWVIVVAAVLVALAITLGFISEAQVTEFIDRLLWAVGLLGGLVGLITAALARSNVDPPSGE